MKHLNISLFAIALLSFDSSSAQSFADRNKRTLLNALPKEVGYWGTYEVTATSASFLFKITPDLLDRTYNLPKDNEAVKKDSSDMSLRTAKDKSFVFLSATVKDVNKSYTDFFSHLNQPTLEVGASFAFNSVYWVNWDKLDEYYSPIKQWDLYAKLFVANTFSKYYDTVNNVESAQKSMPLFNYGSQIDFIAYRKRMWFPITFTIIRGMIVDNTKPYSGLPSTIDLSNERYDIGKPEGKYGGILDKNQWNSRVSIAMLYFLGDAKYDNWYNRSLSRFCLLPNYSTHGTIDKKWSHIAGASIGFLKEKYNTTENTSLDIKPQIQFGVDWQSDPITHVWSKPYWVVSIKGSITK